MTDVPQPTLPRVLHSTVGGVQLNDEQKTAIKDASGVDVEWLLFTRSVDRVARALDEGALVVTRLTYCW